jgi:diacylglycerol kinase (ATP)
VHVAIVVNPVSGHARHRLPLRAIEARARAVLASSSADISVHQTEGPGHGRELARQAAHAGADVVCAWGGDGTVNAVASGLAFGPAALAIVPVGSGNGFARDLGIPLRPDAALALAVRGRRRMVDVANANGRLFVCTAGIGFDGHVAHVFAGLAGERRGAFGYVMAGALEVFRYTAPQCRIEADGRVLLDGPMKLVTVANTRQWGNNVYVAPTAVPDDGLLDVVALADRSLVLLAPQAWRLLAGSTDAIKGITTWTCRHVVVRTDEPAPMHVDGEPCGQTDHLEVSIHPLALGVMVPARPPAQRR